MAILPLGHNYNLASPGILGAFYTAAPWCWRRARTPAEIFRLVARRSA
jgi:non-ribosomal peptide synthetase component E (peptide arylation enzyme)